VTPNLHINSHITTPTLSAQGGGKKRGVEGGAGAAVSPHTQSALRRTLTRMETSLSGAQPNRWGASYPTQLKVRILQGSS